MRSPSSSRSSGLEQVFIFGGSAGTLSAMELAIRHPERCRALVLAVPAAYAPTRAPNTAGVEGDFWFGVMRAVLGSDFLFWSLMKLSPDTMTQMLLATDPALVAAAEPDEQARVQGILTGILPVSQRADGLLIDMATAGDPQPMALERIACPVLTVSLKDDLFGTPILPNTSRPGSRTAGRSSTRQAGTSGSATTRKSGARSGRSCGRWRATPLPERIADRRQVRTSPAIGSGADSLSGRAKKNSA
jgi:pimeloyl-ACP methyl ester carboxylesterase